MQAIYSSICLMLFFPGLIFAGSADPVENAINNVMGKCASSPFTQTTFLEKIIPVESQSSIRGDIQRLEWGQSQRNMQMFKAKTAFNSWVSACGDMIKSDQMQGAKLQITNSLFIAWQGEEKSFQQNDKNLQSGLNTLAGKLDDSNYMPQYSNASGRTRANCDAALKGAIKTVKTDTLNFENANTKTLHNSGCQNTYLPPGTPENPN